MATTRSRDERQTHARPGFIVDECQRLQKSRQHPRLVIAFSIICALMTIGYGSYLYSKLIAHSENLSSKLTSLETNIEGMEEKVRQIEVDNNDISLQLVTVNPNIDKAIDAKIKTSEKIMLRNNYPTSQPKMTSHGSLDEVKTLQQVLAKNVSDIVKRIYAMEEANKDLEGRFSSSMNDMRPKYKIICKNGNCVHQNGNMKENK